MRRHECDWYLIGLDRQYEQRTRFALDASGFRIFDALRRSRHSPVSGRGTVDGPLLPGFCFVGISGRPPDILDSFRGISFILRHEKGRPLCIPDTRICELGVYCDAANAETMPDALHVLDVLAFEDRLNHIVDWLQAPAPNSRRDEGGPAARTIRSHPAPAPS